MSFRSACFSDKHFFGIKRYFPMDIRVAVPHGSVLPYHTAGRSGITVAKQY
jgi:hypothetical protein